MPDVVQLFAPALTFFEGLSVMSTVLLTIMTLSSLAVLSLAIVTLCDVARRWYARTPAKWRIPDLCVVGAGISALLLVVATAAACSPTHAGVTPKIVNAAQKRDTICAFARSWAAAQPELEPVVQACAADQTLQEIAAIYAGCTPPE